MDWFYQAAMVVCINYILHVAQVYEHYILPASNLLLTCLYNTQSAMFISGADEKGELPRGWNWVDVVKVRPILISLIWSPKMMTMLSFSSLLTLANEHNLFHQLPRMQHVS